MTKRLMSDQEQAAAKLIGDTVRASEQNQDEIGAAVGVSQGLIWQWANGRVPVPANRAVVLANVLGLDPCDISPAYREIIAAAHLTQLRPDEAALLAKYRLADEAGKRSLQAVSDALAQYTPHSDKVSNGN